METKTLTDAEFAILGLVAEVPRHGYALEKIIAERGMRDWTEIGFSSIYFVLSKLEKRGLVVAKRAAGRGKGRKIYQPSMVGFAELTERIKQVLSVPEPAYPSVLLGMANWPLLDQDAACGALKTRSKALETLIIGIEDKRKSQRPMPDFVEILFDHSLSQLRAEVVWIADSLEKIGVGKMDKTDFKKTLKNLYVPTHKKFVTVDVPKLQFVMIDGEGSPAGDVYGQAIQWLYSVIYPIKFMAKQRLGKDFVAPPLEGLWWADDMNDFVNDNKDKWKWRMMIVTPDWVDAELFEAAVAKAEQKFGDRPQSLKLEKFEEGKCVQIMHIGSYADEGPTLAKLHNEYLPENGLVENGHHHEIYLNDPRRTAPEKLKTVLRQPVRAK